MRLALLSETLIDGRTIRTFNVIDDFNHEALCVEVDVSMLSLRITRVLHQVLGGGENRWLCT